MRGLVFCLALLPGVAAAQDLMGAAEFDAYVTGKTITYEQFGQPYGVEEYLPGRKVRWAFTEDECRYGEWYPQNEQICFVYDYDPTPQCWTFWVEGGALHGLYDGNPAEQVLVETGQTDRPLGCPGPDVGV